MGKATQDLKKEHDAILYVLQIMDKMMLSGAGEEETLLRYYDEVVFFLKTFADMCHHGKEENYLFKALVKKGVPNEGGLIGAMLQEHAQGRDYIAQMGRCHTKKDIAGFNRAAAHYRDLLKRHIDKENNVLFPMADNMIDEQEQDILFEQFEQFEENIIGHGIHEKLHAMIDTWAEAFRVE
ncbi:MAG: Hemerythrin HHE cation binding domain protein [Smithella sp. PtaU1.Bin162]|nr:MAG: Hemerythrin HHE cation binding domain protein [Smithella sp. PtaU1.Bin162]